MTAAARRWWRVNPWLPVVLWAVLIFAVSSRPKLPSVTPSFIPGSDKVLHAGVYYVLCLLTVRAWYGGGRRPWRQALLVGIAFSALYGFTDEWHQAYVPRRRADALDWVADVGGACLVLVGAERWRRWLQGGAGSGTGAQPEFPETP